MPSPAGAKEVLRKQPKGPAAIIPRSSFISAAAEDMPVIASSKDELRAIFKLANIKVKPLQVDRAWLALSSGEARVGFSALDGYGRGRLATKVAIAGVLRNSSFSAFLVVALANLAFCFHWRGGRGKTRRKAGPRGRHARGGNGIAGCRSGKAEEPRESAGRLGGFRPKDDAKSSSLSPRRLGANY